MWSIIITKNDHHVGKASHLLSCHSCTWWLPSARFNFCTL